MVAAGNLRRLIIRKPDGKPLLEIPLTAGVVSRGAVTILVPVLAALVAKLQVNLTRFHSVFATNSKHRWLRKAMLQGN